MPCYDSRDHDGSATEALRARVVFMEAALCATLNALRRINLIHADPLDSIDYVEAGIAKKDLNRWWQEHIAKDEARKIREEADRQRKVLREDALAKLSDEEKKVLGLK